MAIEDVTQRFLRVTAAFDAEKIPYALVGGQAVALCAVLRSRVLHGLITDEATAQGLVTDKPETTSGKERSKSRKGK